MSKLFIICGHGDGDSGAIGYGYNEAERVRTLAAKIKEFGGNNVIIGNTSKNWYKDKLVNSINIPKGNLALELHMDSSPIITAKGAHVTIDANFEPDRYDEALADFISGIFPGRAEKIVKRNDLSNLNRPQQAGINYRLLECGFISNSNDAKIFNSKMDEIAKGILKCFDIEPIVKQAEPATTTTTAGKLYRVQVGAFSVKANAEKLKNELIAKGYNAIVKED